MAIDLSPILDEVNSLCSADKADYSNLIFEEFIEDQDFAQQHRIDTDVSNGQLIMVMDNRADYGYLKKGAGNCTPNVCDVTAPVSAKPWSPMPYDCRLTICKETLECDFRKFWKMRCNDFEDMNDGFMSFLSDKIKANLNASQWRIAYFDYKTNTDPLYAGIDGLFWQYNVLAPDGAPNRIDIPENAAATIPGQRALAADRGLKVFQGMYDWAAVNNPKLLQHPDLKFEATAGLVFNYMKWLQANKEVNCCFSNTDGVTDTRYDMNRITYLGIPIIIRNEWDGVIAWEQEKTGSTNLNNPNRATLTYTNNKPIGTCDDESFKKFDMFYDRKDKEIIIDTYTSLDAKVILPNDFALAM